MMESIPHYNSKEKYAFTTLTSVLDIILISVKITTKIEKKVIIYRYDYLSRKPKESIHTCTELMTLSNSG